MSSILTYGIFILLVIFVGVFYSFKAMRDINKEFRDYQGIRMEYKGVFYFKLISTLLFIILLTSVFFIEIQFLSMFLILINLVLIYLERRIFQKVVKKIRLLREKHEEGDLPVRTKRHKVVPFFYGVLLVTLILLGFITKLYMDYKEFSNYPNEIVITQDSIMCSNTGYIRCFEDEVLEEYSLETIELILNESTVDPLTQVNVYRVDINYNDSYYSILSDDIHMKEGEEYTLNIDFEKCLNDQEEQVENYEQVRISLVTKHQLNDASHSARDKELEFDEFKLIFVR